MLHPTSRRQFLKTTALASAAVPVGFAATAGAADDKPVTWQFGNDLYRVAFDTTSGEFHVARKDGTRLVARARAGVRMTAGTRLSSDAEYTRSVETRAATEELFGGNQLVARCLDGRKQLDLEIRLTLAERVQAVVVEVVCRNVSRDPLIVQSLDPVRAQADEGGICCWPGTSKVLTNGQMYYDAGRVRDFRAGEETRSWWNVAFFAGENREGLVAGYLENKLSRGQLTIKPAEQGTGATGQGSFSFTATSSYQEEFVLSPGASVSSDRFVFLVAPNPFVALETYAGLIGRLHRVRLNPPVNGWCSWFSFFGDITEDEVLRSAEFAAKQLKPFGFETVQVDDGFYRAFGDWEGNARFSHGMKWLAQRIRELGLKPGIWLAPYVIADGTDVFRQHPEWLIRNPDGKLKQIGPGLVEGSKEAEQQNPKLHALDVTHPGAAEWLRRLFATVVHDWGYDFIKIDFVEWSLLAAERYHDPAKTKAAVYRRGVEIMRQAMGPKRHLLDCGPGNVSVGLIDSMRIELDQPPVTWQQYFLHPASTAPAAAKRYYFHNRTWINDADHVVLANLTPTQAQAAATIVSLSGGNMIAGDRLQDLDPTRLEILNKVFPSLGEAARPVDLFESDRPEVFALNLKRRFGEWLVLGLFNGDPQLPKEKRITLDRLGLDGTKTYVAFNFWEQKFHGELRGSLSVKLPPASVLLLAIHEQRAAPHVISTDRHVSQGGVELEDVEWDAASKTLRGVSLGAAGTDHNVFVYLPEPHPWTQTAPFFFHDFPGYTLKMADEHILRVRVRFAETGRVPWNVNLPILFGG